MKHVYETALRLVGHDDIAFDDLVVWHSPFGVCVAAMKHFNDRGVCLGRLSGFPSIAHMSEGEIDAAMDRMSAIPATTPLLDWSSARHTVGELCALVAHRRAEERRGARDRALLMLAAAPTANARIGYSSLGVHVRTPEVRFVETADVSLRGAIDSALRFRTKFGALIRADAHFVEPAEWLN